MKMYKKLPELLVIQRETYKKAKELKKK